MLNTLMNLITKPRHLNLTMPKKVLVVDDDPVVRILVGECLTAKGYQVTVAEDGADCFKHLASDNPDIVILDFFMPDMNGMDILLEMRKNPTFAKLPILILSADSGTEKILKENNAIPDAFLQKPIALDQIVNAVMDISGDRPATPVPSAN